MDAGFEYLNILRSDESLKESCKFYGLSCNAQGTLDRPLCLTPKIFNFHSLYIINDTFLDFL